MTAKKRNTLSPKQKSGAKSKSGAKKRLTLQKTNDESAMFERKQFEC